MALTQNGREDWDYDRLAGEGAAFARGLAGRGLRRGDRIAILASNQPAWFAVCVGALRAGVVVVPVDAQLADEVTAHVLEDCAPRALVTTSDQAARIEGLGLASPPLLILLDGDENDGRHWRKALQESAEERPPEQATEGQTGAGQAPEAPASEVQAPEAGAREAQEAETPAETPAEAQTAVSPSDTAVIFYTSGTTGMPKGVPLTHANLVHPLNALAGYDLVTEKDRVLLPLPLHHVYPFAIGMLLPLALGVALVLPSLLTGPQLVRALREGEVTAIIGVPRLYRSLYEGILGRVRSLGLARRLLLGGLMRLSLGLSRGLGLRWGKWLLRPLHRSLGPSLRLLACGGSPLDPALAYRLEGLGWRLAIGYGLTETSGLLTLNLPESLPGQGRLSSVGRPMDGVELRIAAGAERADEREGGQDGFGEVLVRGPNIFHGYLHLAEETREAFTADGWFKTGDRGRVDGDGLLILGGRSSTLIVTEGGENIQPEHLEEAYGRHPSIREIGVLQQDGKLVGLVVPEAREIGPEAEQGMRELIRLAIAERSKTLPSYQRLADFAISRESLARTRLGKIQRHKLAEHYEKARRGETGAVGGDRPIAVTEMSDADQSILEDAAARKTWDWLARRYPDVRLTPDTSPQLDLGIDSLEWIGISLEIRERTGVELTEAAIGKVESIRDLLAAVAEGGADEPRLERAEPLEAPEEYLDEEALAWLRPQGLGLRILARLVFAVNRPVFRLYFRLQVEGTENLPQQGPYLLTPNHLSYLDAPALADALGFDRCTRLNWAGAAPIMLANPFMRLVTRVGRVAPIDPKGAALSSLAFGALILGRGNGLVWFPEGRFSRSGALQRLQPGIGILAERFEVPIVPVWIEGTETALPPGRFWPRPHRVRVRFGAPLDPRALRQSGEGDKPHQRITDALRRHMLALGGRVDAP